MRLFFIFSGFLFLTLAVSFSACNRAPSGMPRVYPCEIILVDGEKPIDSMPLKLICDPPVSSLVVTATTNAQGIAKPLCIFANYEKTGLPEGNWTVIINEIVNVPDTKSAMEIDMLSPADRERYEKQKEDQRAKGPRRTPYILSKEATSPLKIEMTSKGTVYRIDVAEYR